MVIKRRNVSTTGVLDGSCLSLGESLMSWTLIRIYFRWKVAEFCIFLSNNNVSTRYGLHKRSFCLFF